MSTTDQIPADHDHAADPFVIRPNDDPEDWADDRRDPNGACSEPGAPPSHGSWVTDQIVDSFHERIA